MGTTKIEWTECTWNPVTGCTKISPGCKNCYAARMAKRLKAMGQPNYVNGFKITCHPHMLERPLSWKKPQMVFVNSMSDLFHKYVPVSFIQDVFDVMRKADWHVFQLLTKRSERLMELSSELPWPDNVWMGVTAENKNFIFRMDHLRKTEAKVKFVSFEPLLSPIPGLDLDGIDWVIVGGESGPGARPMKEEWVVDIRNGCVDAGVPFFFKQWGGTNKKKAGRMLEGRIWDEVPHDSKRQVGRKMLKIKTKSVYSPVEVDDGIRILVMRKWPRGIGYEKNRIDMWMKDVAPSLELLNDWNDGRISWAEYEERFFKEMEGQKEKLLEIRDMAIKGTVTLLCKERGEPEDTILCHRRLLKGLVQKG